jgi:multicomponent Na+:H+ antiporter subunit G
VKDVLILVSMVGGSVFMLLAAVGVMRMPDLYTRMHAATKVGTVGVIGVMLAVALHFGELGIVTRALLIMVFFLITAPVAAHMIGRSAYLAKTPMWKGTILNEWPDPTSDRSAGPDPGGETPKV